MKIRQYYTVTLLDGTNHHFYRRCYEIQREPRYLICKHTDLVGNEVVTYIPHNQIKMIQKNVDWEEENNENDENK